MPQIYNKLSIVVFVYQIQKFLSLAWRKARDESINYGTPLFDACNTDYKLNVIDNHPTFLNCSDTFNQKGDKNLQYLSQCRKHVKNIVFFCINVLLLTMQ